MKIKRLLRLSIFALIPLGVWKYNTYSQHFPVSDHYDGNRFVNLNHQAIHKTFGQVLYWKLTSTPTPWPQYVANDNLTPELTPLANPQQMRIIFINHSTVLLQWHNLNIITDPVLVAGIGPEYLAWLKRHRPPGLSLEQLPTIDYILISHNHYDHLDRPTIKAIVDRDNSTIITPLGVTQYLPSLKNPKLHELDWWQKYTDENHDLSLTLVPAFHWSKRNLFISNESLWGGFVIEKNGLSAYFAGDTGYAEHFQLIHQRFPKLDVALIPIGSYEPRYFMKLAHLNPEDAVLAAKDLKARQNIGIHFGTFRLSDEGIDAPKVALASAVEKLRLKTPFTAPKNGQTFYATRQ